MEYKVKYAVEHVVAHRRLGRTHPNGRVTAIDIFIGDMAVMPAEHSNSFEYGQAWLEITGAGLGDTCHAEAKHGSAFPCSGRRSGA